MAQASGARQVSLLDNVGYNLVQVLPYVTQGVFTRNRRIFGLWARFHPDPLAVRFVSYLRRKYGSDYLYVSMLTTRSLLVLDVAGVRHVLDNSPTVYAEPRAKRSGMSHFQPHALTISRGAAWRDRRRFNVDVLGGAEQLHRHAGEYLHIIRDEVLRHEMRQGARLTFDDLQRLFQRITLQIVFGREARHDTALLERLRRMMQEANRSVGLRPSKHFGAFYSGVRRYLRRRQPGSLAAESGAAPATAETRVEHQIPHWLFAMNETLAANTARALALIVAYPQATARVQAELRGEDLTTPAGIRRLAYLEGCLQEAMRLWPTVALLARETVRPDALGGSTIPPGTQVLILNGFNHRDRERFPQADDFSPELWLSGDPGYRFNHLSHGPQVCAGVGLTLYIGKAVLATLLSRHRYRLTRPLLPAQGPLPHALDYFALTLDPLSAASPRPAPASPPP